MALWASSSWQTLFLSSSSPTHGNGRSRIIRNGSRRGLDTVVHVGTADTEAVTTIAYEEGERERPKWAEETPLSRLVNALVSFKPLYSVLKLGARQVFIRFSSSFLSLPQTHIHIAAVFRVFFFLCYNIVRCIWNPTVQRKRTIFHGGRWQMRFWNQMFIWSCKTLRIPPSNTQIV